jgi:hypothetical protein
VPAADVSFEFTEDSFDFKVLHNGVNLRLTKSNLTSEINVEKSKLFTKPNKFRLKLVKADSHRWTKISKDDKS